MMMMMIIALQRDICGKFMHFVLLSSDYAVMGWISHCSLGLVFQLLWVLMSYLNTSLFACQDTYERPVQCCMRALACRDENIFVINVCPTVMPQLHLTANALHLPSTQSAEKHLREAGCVFSKPRCSKPSSSVNSHNAAKAMTARTQRLSTAAVLPQQSFFFLWKSAFCCISIYRFENFKCWNID